MPERAKQGVNSTYDRSICLKQADFTKISRKSSTCIKVAQF